MYKEYSGDTYIIRRKIKDDYSNYNINYIDSIKDVYTQIFTPTLFGGNMCYVVFDDAFIKNKEIIEKIESSKNIVVNIVKNATERSEVLNKLNETSLKHILKPFKLPEDRVNKLIQACDCDLGAIELTLNKMRNDDNDLFEEHISVYDTDNSVFEYTNTFVSKDVNKLFELNKIYENELLAILKLLHNNLINAIIAGKKQIDKTNMYKTAYARAKNIYHTFGEEDIIRIIHIIYDIEKEFKTGRGYNKHYLDTLCIRVFKA